MRLSRVMRSVRCPPISKLVAPFQFQGDQDVLPISHDIFHAQLLLAAFCTELYLLLVEALTDLYR